MRKSAIIIKKDAHVHHPQHGIGKIQSIRKRSFYQSEEANYAQLYFERDALTLTLLEKDLANTVRRLITAKEAQDLLDQTRNWDGEAKSQWKARADTHEAAISGGNPFEYAKVVKELNKMDPDEPLRNRDRANLDQSFNLLVEELARALKKTPKQAHKLISEATGA